METQDQNQKDTFNHEHPYWHQPPSRIGRILGGLVVVAVGCVFLAKQMGAVFPSWLFSWEMLLITLGIFTGFKHMFRNKAWIIMITVGAIFLTDDIFPGVHVSHFLLPILIIAAGLMFMIKPRRRCYGPRDRWKRRLEQKWEQKYKDKYSQYEDLSNSDSHLDSVSILGGVKKNIISKDFKGGEIVCVFGGGEINLMQADINGRVELEVTLVFGGAKLIIPSNWTVLSSEMVAIFGGIEDKRTIQKDNIDESKILVLKGNCIFGGMEIKSY